MATTCRRISLDHDPYDLDYKGRQFDSVQPGDDYFSFKFRTTIEEVDERNRVLNIVMDFYSKQIRYFIDRHGQYDGADSANFRAMHSELIPLPSTLRVSPPESRFSNVLFRHEIFNPEYWMFWVYKWSEHDDYNGVETPVLCGRLFCKPRAAVYAETMRFHRWSHYIVCADENMDYIDVLEYGDYTPPMHNLANNA